MVEVTAKLKDGDPVTVEYALAEDLEGLVAQFEVEGEEGKGEEVVYNNARANIIVGLQSYIRGRLRPDENGKVASQKEIQKAVDEWRPGSRQPAKSKVEKAADLYEQMSEEERKALIAKLQAG